MPEDYLSRRPGSKVAIANIAPLDPFQADHFDQQMKDDGLQMLQTYMTKNNWPPQLSKWDQQYFKNLADKAFQDKNKVVWVRLDNFIYCRTAL